MAENVPGPAVVVERAGGVSSIILNRPQKMNAVTVDLATRLAGALRAEGDRARVIVLRGAGGNFSVGGDFDEVRRLAAEGPQALRALFDNFGAACAIIPQLPVPVVAVVEGYALAGGFELAQASDIVVVAENAQLSDNHVNFGMIPGGGGSQRLPRLVGRQRALAHMLTGDRLSGADAVAWGLAYASAPATDMDACVADLCERLVTKNPEALRQTKRLIYESFARPLGEGLALERDTIVEHLAGPTGQEAFTSFSSRKQTS